MTAVTVVGSGAVNNSASQTSLTLTLPTVATDDWLIACTGGSSQTSGVVSSTSGGTIGGSLTQVGSNVTGGSGHITSVWKRKLVAADSGKTVTFAYTAGNFVSIAWIVLRGGDTTDIIDAVQSNSSSSTTASETTPAATTVGASCAELSIVSWTGNVAAAITASNPPGGITKAVDSVHSGGATTRVLVGIGHNLTGVSAGSSIGSRAWTVTTAASGGPHSGWTLSLVPAVPAAGAATGAIAWVGTAAGKAARSGAATGAISWAGTAAGSSPKKGNASGDVAWSGTAAGKTTRQGSTAGQITWVGTATGSAPHKGSAVGGITWAGTASSSSIHQGAASGTISWSGTAVGSAPVLEPSTGSAVGVLAWVGAATGSTQRRGAAAGAITWEGAATGMWPIQPAPVVLEPGAQFAAAYVAAATATTLHTSAEFGPYTAGASW